ncbi:MAG: hypothetical protein LBE99_00745, partial [Puniceicoccales bacterium]|nr:hypothetical protein [Puniceicoccales bacterium]
EFYDSNGKPLKQVGTLANGRPVYQGQDFLSPKLQLWALGEYSEGDCMLVTRVEKSFGRFAYTNYNAYCMAYLFDGRVWINKYTGKIYNSVEELP